MKKILLFSIMSIATFGGYAQKAIPGGKVVRDVNKERVVTTPVKPSISKADKKTRATSRWYDPLEASLVYFNGDTTGLDFNTGSTPMWSDSTMRIRYSQAVGPTYLGGIYLKSVGQVLDPFAKRFNDHTKLPDYIGEMAIRTTDAYTLDTIAIAGAYYRNATKGSIVDTLIISVGYGNLSGGTSAIGARYVLHGGNAATTIACYPGIDTMSLPALDMNMASYNLAGTGVITKKILLNAADSGAKYFATDVNLAVPAGNLVAMSLVFKSGDTWVPNVDTMADFNFFRVFSTEEQTGIVQNYEKKDYNSTQTFENDTTGWGTSYVPNHLYVIGQSGCSGTFDREQYWTLWRITSNSTAVVSTNDISNIESISASPNPASSTVNFSFNLNQNANNVSIEIANAIGQVVKTAKVGTVNANTTSSTSVSLDGLAKGMYIYTIIADGQKVSNKLMID